MLPSTSKIVKVTNVKTLYAVRIYETEHYEKKLNSIKKKLLAKTEIFSNDTKDIEAKVRDAVVVHNRSNKAINLPYKLCRGHISGIAEDSNKGTYNILLDDYGISVTTRRDDFYLCSANLISEEYLSFTVGLYNILPIQVKRDSSLDNETPIILKEWSLSAIEYTRELIGISDTTYFDPLASDHNGRCYGEFYLKIQNEIVCLSQALELNSHAIYLNRKVLESRTNPRISEEEGEKAIPKELNDKSCQQKESSTKEMYSHSDWDKFEKDRENVLIYGKGKRERLDTVAKAEFPTEIYKGWKLSIQQDNRFPKRIQSYAWPAMQKGLSVIAVGPPKCGKTVGCGYAICGILAKEKSKLPGGAKPSALILCPSSNEVVELDILCKTFLQYDKYVKSVAAIKDKNITSLTAQMMNGCQILISTPKFLITLMDKWSKLDLKFVKHLVLDNADVIWNRYHESVSKILRNNKIIVNRKAKSLQIIMTATHWTENLKKITPVLIDDPWICFGSCLEAAIYKSVRFTLHMTNSERKNQVLLDLLEDEYLKSRVMVICTNDDEAKELHSFLIKRKESLLAHGNMDIPRLESITRSWNDCTSGSFPILICTENILSDLGVKNIEWLIHYSLPLHSKTAFTLRFSTLLDNLQMKHCNCKVTMILDENNDMQFLHLVKVMQRGMGNQITRNVLEKVKLVRAGLEKKKKNYPICDNIKSWGFCEKQQFCAFRHQIIPEIDAPLTNIQINDKVKFQVVSIHDATHFSARIISYIKSGTGEEVQFSSIESIRITMKIQKFYSLVENRKRCEAIEVGNICGLDESLEDTFTRVQILSVESHHETGVPKYVDVKCLDNGVILRKLKVHKLLDMPEELAKLPIGIVEVFLTGIVPHDEEYVWNTCAIDSVNQWFRKNIDDNSHVIGQVNFHLGNTLWIHSLVVKTKIIGCKDLHYHCLRKELLKSHAVENDRHLSLIIKLCRNSGLMLSESPELS